MTADSLTKALPREAFTRRTSAIGLILAGSHYICNKCFTSFVSRNALYQHLRHYCLDPSRP